VDAASERKLTREADPREVASRRTVKLRVDVGDGKPRVSHGWVDRTGPIVPAGERSL
jgi:hypothetical protein